MRKPAPSTFAANQRHEITVYSAVGPVAGVCSGNEILLTLTTRISNAWQQYAIHRPVGRRQPTYSDLKASTALIRVALSAGRDAANNAIKSKTSVAPPKAIGSNPGMP
jgi:hypothetical protein